MSELKAFRIIQGDTGGCGAPSYKCDTNGNLIEEWSDYREVYDKSEADKVIAELKADYKEACGRLQNANLIKDEQLAAARHNKYKRCLAMAKRCDEVMMSCELRGYAINRIWFNRHQWAMRWKYRWLELAEQFKEAK